MDQIKINQFSHKHILSIEDLSPLDINLILNIAEKYASQNKLNESR